ncbi:replication initiation protein [Clostridium perfringens]|uniref:replication initiation protein n=1 Tax=Clostridium perfringens TaxID=1502 RepID=UPI000D71B82A|nr:replication initiation protein [Clostridium perfringens]MBO3424416.1 RepB family plasmid replication initiator protein [Clostridium perfringens]PWX10404.1 replication protein RepB [Clostridium perfringens]PWX37270.1 replication protein RepB [Clostridium perfringens]PWX59083.1 replication protein RepB [Clostridium perfringens]
MEKNYIVTKANNLIKASYSLTLQEQKLILSLASMVSPNDADFKEYTLEIKKFMQILEIETQTKYSEIPKITKELMKKVFEIREGKEILQLSWLSSVKYKTGEGKVILKFDSSLKPYMLQLKELYTSYKLENILLLRSKYSLRIYEILKSNQFKKYWEITLVELKYILGIKEKSYDTYQNLKNRVILKAQIELKEKTDIYFEFEEIKTGRKVTSLKFIIKSNKNNKKLLSDNLNDISVDNAEIIEDKNILILKELFQDQVSIKNLKKILESANNDIEKIKKIYEYSKTQKIDNLVGFMIKMVKDSNFEEPIKQDKDYKKIHNFTEREDYDYQKLEKGLLGWDNDEILESIEENKIIANEGSKMDFKGSENENRTNIIDEIKNILEGQLTAIFGELRYKTWIKPSVDNIEIENNNIKFVFSNDFVKKKFENEFENIIKEIIKGIDNNFNVKKTTN